MSDENGTPVPEAVASQEKATPTTSPEASPKPEVTQTSVLTEDRVKAMIAEAAAKAVADAKETGRRELQSQQDRNRVEREKLLREKAALITRLKDTDPEALDEIDLQRFRSEEAEKAKLESQQSEIDGAEKAKETFFTDMRERITDLGLDPDDQGIDWAKDATSFSEANSRILKSVSRIQKSRAEKANAETAKAIESRVRQSLGIDSVDTSQGGGATSDGSWIRQWSDGTLPATKENIAKAEKLINA